MLISERIKNFQDLDGPRFEASYAGMPPDFPGQLKVVTWNIKFSEKIDLAITELSDVQALRDADIILLQEMDEVGVEAIARALGYNYVYYPTSIHPRRNRYFGNAILSRWPILGTKKLILPHRNPIDEQQRIAVRAFIAAGDHQVVAYSVHTETFMLGPGKRHEQIDTVVEDIARGDYGYVVVGGDFNTLTHKSVGDLEKKFGRVGLVRVSEGIGPTIKLPILGLTLDHVLVRGMSAVDKGVWSETKASDHSPIWVQLLLDQRSVEKQVPVLF